MTELLCATGNGGIRKEVRAQTFRPDQEIPRALQDDRLPGYTRPPSASADAGYDVERDALSTGQQAATDPGKVDSVERL